MPKTMKNGLFNHGNAEAAFTSKLFIDSVTPSVNSNPMIPHQPDKGLFLTSVSLVPKVLPVKTKASRKYTRPFGFGGGATSITLSQQITAHFGGITHKQGSIPPIKLLGVKSKIRHWPIEKEGGKFRLFLAFEER
jgi:hypothetical protein